MQIAPNFEKGHFKASKRKNSSWVGTSSQMGFLTISDEINFFDFLKEEMRPTVGRI